MKKLVVTLALAACALTTVAQDFGKLSAHLSALVRRQSSTAVAAPAADALRGRQVPHPILTLLTTAPGTSATALESDYGCRVVDSVGRVYIVSVPLSAVAALSEDSRVERIEAERMPRPAMDVTPAQVDALPLYSGEALPQAFNGSGVAAGVFDCGFDFTHPAFYDSLGRLRVDYYYDFLWPNDDGTLGHALETTDDIARYGHSQHVNPSIHGTHVMGTMAGSAIDGKYQGMAPGASLYVADFNSQRADFENPDAETSAVAVLGFKRLFDRAARDGKPCVVNFSSCESITLTRQRTLEAEALQQLTGPGRIIVAAAGNDGFRSAFMEKPADVRQAGTGIINGVGSGQKIDIDLVTPADQLVRFDFLGLKLMGGTIEGTITFHTDSILAMQGDTCRLSTTVSMGAVDLAVTLSPHRDARGDVFHIDGHMPHLAYLVLCGATCLLTGDGPAWMYSDVFFSPFTNISGVPAYSHALPGYNVSWPATLPGIIAVGATGYKNTVRNLDGQDYTDMLSFAPEREGLVTQFSSRGPTFDGLMKPDVVAPGLNINAACNSFVDLTDALRKELTYRVSANGKDYYITAQSGTSMAAPVVAGTIALWLQAKPDLTPQEALQVIAATATHPDPTLAYPNATYGHGQIDAYRGLLHVLQLPSALPQLSLHQPREARFVLSGRLLSVDTGDTPDDRPLLLVYTLQGRLAAKASATSIDLSSLPAGLYAVQLKTSRAATTGSTLIRLSQP